MPDNLSTIADRNEISVETAIGKFKAQGNNIMTGATLIVTICGFTIGWVVFEAHSKDSRDDRNAFVQAIRENTQANRQAAGEQRVANCLNSLLPEQKSQQMIDFCKSLGNGR